MDIIVILMQESSWHVSNLIVTIILCNVWRIKFIQNKTYCERIMGEKISLALEYTHKQIKMCFLYLLIAWDPRQRCSDGGTPESTESTQRCWRSWKIIKRLMQIKAVAQFFSKSATEEKN